MYEFKSRVSYSMVNEDGCLSLPNVVNYFQDCALFHANDVGYDLDSMKASHRAWLLSTWHIVVNRFPKMGENVIIKTWPYDFKIIYGMRNTTLETEDGEILAYSDSHWFYFDSEKLRPVTPTEEEVKNYGMGEKMDMEYLPRRVKCEAETKEVGSVKILHEDLDTNHHVNNGIYVRISANYLPSDVRPTELRIEYRNAAHLDDILTIHRAENESHYFIILKKQDDTICTIAEFKKHS